MSIYEVEKELKRLEKEKADLEKEYSTRIPILNRLIETWKETLASEEK